MRQSDKGSWRVQDHKLWSLGTARLHTWSLTLYPRVYPHNYSKREPVLEIAYPFASRRRFGRWWRCWLSLRLAALLWSWISRTPQVACRHYARKPRLLLYSAQLLKKTEQSL
ncbi:hypothetical protein CJF30_00009535 [Rutstroemia sp. NJR-2017a BBW]|nr:hypothetical protein CJF30_00009535 [Rutstroemia sp. NJR-2017a BBW]